MRVDLLIITYNKKGQEHIAKARAILESLSLAILTIPISANPRGLGTGDMCGPDLKYNY